MGKPKFSKKKYETPNHPWKEARIKAENELVAKYGLKNKREIWKAETALRNYRGQARSLLAKIGSEDPQAKKEMHQLLSHLTRYSILPLNSTLDDVLALETEAILSRRLQTLTYLKGFATTPKHARQLINHGHVSIDGRCVNVPGYRVTKEEEKDIEYVTDSPLNDQAHPARPSGDFVSKTTGGPEQAVQTPPAASKEKPEKPAEKPKEEAKQPDTKPADSTEPKEKPATPSKEQEKPKEKETPAVAKKEEKPPEKPKEEPKKDGSDA
jgi:small subunit ribosomal protein S4